jgi:rhodanese-related sulfurtransferase
MSEAEKAQPIRIPVEEAKERYDQDEVTVVDVVDPAAYEHFSYQIENAIRIDPREISDEFGRLPKDCSVLTY